MREHWEHIYSISFSRKESVEEPEYLGVGSYFKGQGAALRRKKNGG